MKWHISRLIALCIISTITVVSSGNIPERGPRFRQAGSRPWISHSAPTSWGQTPSPFREAARQLPCETFRCVRGADGVERAVRPADTPDLGKNFVIKSSQKTEVGTKMVRFEQKMKKVRVYDVTITAELVQEPDYYRAETIRAKTVKNFGTKLPCVEPSITPKEALMGFQHRRKDTGKSISQERTELVIWAQMPGGRPMLAYRVSYYVEWFDHDTYQYKQDLPVGIVFAHWCHLILDSWSGLNTAREPQQLSGVLRNTETGLQRDTLTVDKESGTNTCFYETSIGDGATLKVIDDRTSKSEFACDQASAETYDSANGAFSPMNAAYKWAFETVDMFKKTVDQAPTPGEGENIVIYAHRPFGEALALTDRIQLADGDDSRYPFTEPDIIAHELGHFYNQVAGGLEYRRQAGAIDEAFCDLTGLALMDSYFGSTEYTIGQTTTKNNSPIRDLCNPDRTDLAGPPGIAHFDDYVDTVGVHEGSGVFGKAFCILSKKSGWNVQKVFKLVAETHFDFTETTSFAEALCGLELNAPMFVPELPVSDITDAFQQVGVVCES